MTAHRQSGQGVSAPAIGRHSYMLPRPELYNLATDPDESYDVAAENPQVVAQIRQKIDEMLGSFPEPVQRAWAAGEVPMDTYPAGSDGPAPWRRTPLPRG